MDSNKKYKCVSCRYWNPSNMYGDGAPCSCNGGKLRKWDYSCKEYAESGRSDKEMDDAIAEQRTSRHYRFYHITSAVCEILSIPTTDKIYEAADKLRTYMENSDKHVYTIIRYDQTGREIANKLRKRFYSKKNVVQAIEAAGLYKSLYIDDVTDLVMKDELEKAADLYTAFINFAEQQNYIQLTQKNCMTNFGIKIINSINIIKEYNQKNFPEYVDEIDDITKRFKSLSEAEQKGILPNIIKFINLVEDNNLLEASQLYSDTQDVLKEKIHVAEKTKIRKK